MFDLYLAMSDGCLEGELENCGNKNLIGKHQTVEMKGRSIKRTNRRTSILKL
jgi:hypothetical protein